MNIDTELAYARGWERRDSADGIVTFRLASWSSFFEFLEAEIFDQTKGPKQRYIWRGQRQSNWSLSTTLDRLFGKLGFLAAEPNVLEAKSASHLRSFKYATRGRRGRNPAPLSENDWWALGQHFGLATPLLDWTLSPFAAAYFAFQELAADPTEYRAVYALNQDVVTQRDVELQDASLETGRPAIFEFVDPLSDENERLVSQGGCFTRTSIGVPIELWVARAFEGSPAMVLIRIEIPDLDRLACLRALNRMNINHLSLFPDLSGASRSTNLKLELES